MSLSHFCLLFQGKLFSVIPSGAEYRGCSPQARPRRPTLSPCISSGLHRRLLALTEGAA